MSAPPTPRAELAAAVRQINALFLAHPEPRPAVYAPPATLTAEIDAAHAAGDRDGALELVELWRAESLRLLNPAPLEVGP